MSENMQNNSRQVVIDTGLSEKLLNSVVENKKSVYYLLVQLVVKDSNIFDWLKLVTGIVSGFFTKIHMTLKDSISQTMSLVRKSAAFNKYLYNIKFKNNPGKTALEMYDLIVDTADDLNALLTSELSYESIEHTRNTLDHLLDVFELSGFNGDAQNSDSALISKANKLVNLVKYVRDNLDRIALVAGEGTLLDGDESSMTPEEIEKVNEIKNLLNQISDVHTGLSFYRNVIENIKTKKIDDFREMAGEAVGVFGGREDSVALCFLGISTMVETFNGAADAISEINDSSGTKEVIKNKMDKIAPLINYLSTVKELASGDVEKMASGLCSTLETIQEFAGDELGDKVNSKLELSKNIMNEFIPHVKYFYTCVVAPQDILGEAVNLLQTKSIHGLIANIGYKRLLIKAMGSCSDEDLRICMNTVINYEWAKYNYELHGHGDATLARQKNILIPLVRMVESSGDNGISKIVADLFDYNTIPQFVEKSGIHAGNYKTPESKSAIIEASTKTLISQVEIAYILSYVYKKLYGGGIDNWDMDEFKVYFETFLQQVSGDAFQHSAAVWDILEKYIKEIV